MIPNSEIRLAAEQYTPYRTPELAENVENGSFSSEPVSDQPDNRSSAKAKKVCGLRGRMSLPDQNHWNIKGAAIRM